MSKRESQMSRNTSSDARLVSKTLGRTFSVQPLVSTVPRNTWALRPIVRIAVLSKRASRSLAQTGFGLPLERNGHFWPPRGPHLGPHFGAHLGPHLGLILEPILASSWRPGGLKTL